MKMAAATSGFERLKWVRVAQAWQDLARTQGAGSRQSTARNTAGD
jgi:hypothetical protein